MSKRPRYDSELADSELSSILDDNENSGLRTLGTLPTELHAGRNYGQWIDSATLSQNDEVQSFEPNAQMSGPATLPISADVHLLYTSKGKSMWRTTTPPTKIADSMTQGASIYTLPQPPNTGASMSLPATYHYFPTHDNKESNQPTQQQLQQGQQIQGHHSTANLTSSRQHSSPE